MSNPDGTNGAPEARAAQGGEMLTVLEWAKERLANTERIALTKSGADRDSWLEDRAYWHAIVASIAAPPAATSEALSALLKTHDKSFALLKSISAECDKVSEHDWHKCRACLATEELEHKGVKVKLRAFLAALSPPPSSPSRPTGEPQP